MRKLRTLPALLVLALVITGCKGPSVPMPGSASHVDLEREVVLSGTVSDGENRWDYRITTYTVSGEHCADDGSGRVLTRHSYQTPSMEVMRSDGQTHVSPDATRAAETFNAHFQRVLEEEVAWFDEMAADAEADYGAVGHQDTGMWSLDAFCYSDEATLDFWSNGRLVCITTARWSYSGGLHPITWRTGETFDLRTGGIVTVTDLTDNVAQLQSAVEQELLRQAEEKQHAEDDPSGNQDKSPVYYDDYPETLHEWMDRPVIFGDEGMTVIFGVYDLASYADGEQTFLIPYECLAPYLNDFGHSVLELPE